MYWQCSRQTVVWCTWFLRLGIRSFLICQKWVLWLSIRYIWWLILVLNRFLFQHNWYGDLYKMPSRCVPQPSNESATRLRKFVVNRLTIVFEMSNWNSQSYCSSAARRKWIFYVIKAALLILHLSFLCQCAAQSNGSMLICRNTPVNTWQDILWWLRHWQGSKVGAVSWWCFFLTL